MKPIYTTSIYPCGAHPLCGHNYSTLIYLVNVKIPPINPSAIRLAPLNRFPECAISGLLFHESPQLLIYAVFTPTTGFTDRRTNLGKEVTNKDIYGLRC